MNKPSKIYFLLPILLTSIMFNMDAYAINSKAIRNASESVVYGAEMMSKTLLDSLLKNIAKPETNPRISLTREQSEAIKVIEESVPSIKNKLELIDSNKFFTMKYRVTRFLEILDTELSKEELEKTKVELSFLLESIDETL